MSSPCHAFPHAGEDDDDDDDDLCFKVLALTAQRPRDMPRTLVLKVVKEFLIPVDRPLLSSPTLVLACLLTAQVPSEESLDPFQSGREIFSNKIALLKALKIQSRDRVW